MPDFKIMPDGEIRVLHLDLDRSWWNRADSTWERDVEAVEDTIRAATGLKRVTQIHSRFYVALRVRRELRARAATAVMLEYGQQSDTSLLDAR